jgi:predicted ester cyclase
MSVEENKAIVRRFVKEVLNEGDLAAVDELVAPDFVADRGSRKHLPGGGIQGIEGLKEFLERHRTENPKALYVPEEMIAEGDKVVGKFKIIWEAGYWRGIPSRRPEVEMASLVIHQVEDGQIKGWSWIHDYLGLQEQLERE